MTDGYLASGCNTERQGKGKRYDTAN